jgi:hypothetical protein
MLMTALFDDPIPAADSARSKSASVNPANPHAPTVRNDRREIPSQFSYLSPSNLSM